MIEEPFHAGILMLCRILGPLASGGSIPEAGGSAILLPGDGTRCLSPWPLEREGRVFVAGPGACCRIERTHRVPEQAGMHKDRREPVRGGAHVEDE